MILFDYFCNNPNLELNEGSICYEKSKQTKTTIEGRE